MNKQSRLHFDKYRKINFIAYIYIVLFKTLKKNLI